MKEELVLTILMATYNGAAYLDKQLDSILRQTYPHWELIIRDDQSTDDTLNIIKAYSEKDERIKYIQYGSAHGTACRNFSALFDWAYENNRPYILFADQDDIWLDYKLERSLAGLLKNESIYGADFPLLCYSNLSFIDEADQKIAARLPLPPQLNLKVLINENYAWGCTMILNRAAVRKIKHIPTESVNHDYYVALVIAAFGKNLLIDENLILYRQHQKNVSGNVDKMRFMSRFNRYFKDTDYMLKPLVDNYKLVHSFFSRYRSELHEDQLNMIQAFLHYYQKSFPALFLTMWKHQIFKIGLGKNVVYFYTLYLLRKKVMAHVKAGRTL
ncbi:glycosyltransferase family 2 protein [Pedobacter sp. R20-19]|uniref:glycosyltransferase family 2 protein n=1 Tax=Pedobacter sp. R20-19 TaxID=1270196 RepID=UPI000493B251|nr:glycosyltransferase family 2 protein [Pedobacter sp. R20-19]